MKPKKIKALEEFTSHTVGDGKSPNLYFVTDQGTVISITRSFERGYSEWRELANRFPRRECALEDRQNGCLCSVEPVEDGSSKLKIYDDSSWIRKRRK